MKDNEVMIKNGDGYFLSFTFGLFLLFAGASNFAYCNNCTVPFFVTLIGFGVVGISLRMMWWIEQGGIGTSHSAGSGSDA